MNYFDPYYMAFPTVNTIPKTSFIKNLFGNINFSSILSGTSKTLNIVNQTIPIVKQAGPIIKNAKTMFSVMNEFKKVENTIPNFNNQNIEQNIEKEKPPVKTSGPTFFL